MHSYHTYLHYTPLYYTLLYYATLLLLIGDVIEISKDEWITHVTDASKAPNTYVIAHLYQDSVIECRLLEEVLITLAAKFKYIKFVRIRSTQAVENWSDKNLPTLFIYKDGELKIQLLTLKEVHGKNTI